MIRSVQLSDFIEVHTVHEPRLRCLAHLLVPNWSDAEDVLQETNLILWQKFDGFEPGTNYMSWASQVLRFVVKRYFSEQKHSKMQFTDQFFDIVTGEATRHSDELGYREDLLHRCIRELTERQRSILQLRYFKGQAVIDVANSIGVTSKAIYHAMEHIHKALLQCVQMHLNEPNSK